MNAIKTVGIVSLSCGMVGESYMGTLRELGEARLESMGLRVKYMPNALRGMDYLGAHPEARAADLLSAYRDPEVDLILCDIGGDDTYRLLPYLFEHGELESAVNDKPFLGFSDTTINHFMIQKAGGRCFYGQSFITELCEMSEDMLPYSRHYFEELVRKGTIQGITPSDVWYEDRTDYTDAQLGVPLVSHPDRGFELLQGSGAFSGEIMGGCLESIYDLLEGRWHKDMPEMCAKYGIFPPLDQWRGRILLLETSELKIEPAFFAQILFRIKKTGIFDAVSGIIFGKPMDEAYDDDYKRLLCGVVGNPGLPIVCNINVGHAMPRCVIPLGVPAAVDAELEMIGFY